MTDVKYSSLWAIAIVVLTILIFALNYNGHPGILPIYKILAWPGIMTLRLFSEEMIFSLSLQSCCQRSMRLTFLSSFSSEK